MRKLPKDPDRAALVPNLFTGLWAATQATGAMLGADSSFMFYFSFGSLFLFGFGTIAIATVLFRSPGQWGSMELVTWTLNVGTLGVAVATAMLLIRFSIDHPVYELAGWVPFCAI